MDRLPEGLIDEIVFWAMHNSPEGWHKRRRTGYSLCVAHRIFLLSAQRELFRAVSLEYSPTRQSLQHFTVAVQGSPRLARFVRSLKISTAAGGATSKERSQGSRNLAGILKDIFQCCHRIEHVAYSPDEAARNWDLDYVTAWKLASFTSFTLALNSFRDLALLPFGKQVPLTHLTLELARGGDLGWDYDIVVGALGQLQAASITLQGFTFPSYADQVMLDKLGQLCDALLPPQQLNFRQCVLSEATISFLVGTWASETLQDIVITGCQINDRQDLRMQRYTLPSLPTSVRSSFHANLTEIA